MPLCYFSGPFLAHYPWSAMAHSSPGYPLGRRTLFAVYCIEENQEKMRGDALTTGAPRCVWLGVVCVWAIAKEVAKYCLSIGARAEQRLANNMVVQLPCAVQVANNVLRRDREHRPKKRCRRLAHTLNFYGNTRYMPSRKHVREKGQGTVVFRIIVQPARPDKGSCVVWYGTSSVDRVVRAGSFLSFCPGTYHRHPNDEQAQARGCHRHSCHSCHPRGARCVLSLEPPVRVLLVPPGLSTHCTKELKSRRQHGPEKAWAVYVCKEFHNVGAGTPGVAHQHRCREQPGATGLETPGIKSDQRDELPEMARRPERKNEKIKKVALERAAGYAWAGHACQRRA